MTQGRHETKFKTEFKRFQQQVHATACKNGWWDVPREDGTVIALMHSELSEALESLRNYTMDDKLTHRKGIEVELGDLIIRVMDFAEKRGYDVAGAMVEKNEFNKSRGYKHGGKAF